MKILLLTTLYPEYENQSIAETSYALHEFAKEWVKEHNIIVIRPIFPVYRDFLSKRKLYPHIHPDFTLDGVHIFNSKVWKLPKLNIYYINNLIDVLKKLNFVPDKILSHMSSSYVLGDILARYYKREHIIGIHISDLKNIEKKSISRIISRTSLIACRSQSIKDILLKNYTQHKSKIFVANSGIDYSDIESHDFFLNKIKTLKDNTTVKFFTASVLEKYKNIEINLEALSRVKNYSWNYIIVGDGREFDYLSKKTHELNIAERVSFLGEKTREEVLDYMKKSDVFIMVSSETFGLAYLEAMAKGNIVIGCKNWGIAGIIIDGENGFLAEERNIDDLEKIVKNIFTMSYDEKKKLILETEKTIKRNTSEIASRKYIEAIRGAHDDSKMEKKENRVV
jgi:glycosyltransferase involved in cell wall biosynthesis